MTSMRMRPTLTTPRLAAVVLCALVVALAAAAPLHAAYGRSPSYALVQVLRAVQNLNVSRALSLMDWARGSAEPPSNPFFPQEHVEVQIAALQRADRDALIAWLRGQGRGRLYARNASDADIGPCKRPIDNAACSDSQHGGAASNVRSLHFALGTGASPVESGIEIEGGFAAVTKDGLTEVHCLSFKNVAAKTATSVTFGYRLLSKESETLDSGSDTRSGTFSPGITIAGPSDYGAYKSATGHRGLQDNCWATTTKVARMAALQAAYLTARVSAVTFADGSSWRAPG